jgi:hypothetical protein
MEIYHYKNQTKEKGIRLSLVETRRQENAFYCAMPIGE